MDLLCHYIIYAHVHVLSHFRPVQFCNLMDCSPPGSSVHGFSPGKNTGVGCHFLLQRIFLSQGSILGLLHCRQILYQLSNREGPKHSLALPFFGIGMKADLFQSCRHCWVFQICWHRWMRIKITVRDCERSS